MCEYIRILDILQRYFNRFLQRDIPEQIGPQIEHPGDSGTPATVTLLLLQRNFYVQAHHVFTQDLSHSLGWCWS